MKILTIILFLTVSSTLKGQTLTYQNEEGETHLCGIIQMEDLGQKPFSSWFNSTYEDFKLKDDNHDWKSTLQDVNVKIFMGTWCSDSQQWVPGFMRLWDGLGLNRSQVNIIAVYDTKDNYKQSPGGEEMGLGIHRVPTFIFEKDAKEIGRIVEYPYTDLETDLQQIAMGNAPESNFKSAQYMHDLMKSKTTQEINNVIENHLKILSEFSYDSAELNKLGYVYLRSGLIEQAKTIFKINTLLFSNESNVYDSYAEALIAAGDTNGALKNYQKVLELDPENKHAQEQVSKLQPQIKN